MGSVVERTNYISSNSVTRDRAGDVKRQTKTTQ